MKKYIHFLTLLPQILWFLMSSFTSSCSSFCYALWLSSFSQTFLYFFKICVLAYLGDLLSKLAPWSHRFSSLSGLTVDFLWLFPIASEISEAFQSTQLAIVCRVKTGDCATAVVNESFKTWSCWGDGGGMDWEFGINRCKLLYIEWINNEVLLYSTGNYI